MTSNDVNNYLDKTHQWALQWKMQFNPDPTKQAVEVLFSRKAKSINHPPLYFNNQIDSFVYSKYSGAGTQVKREDTPGLLRPHDTVP